MTLSPGRREARSGVLVIGAHYPPATKAGGPARTLGAMVASTSADTEVYILTSDRDHTEKSKMAVTSNKWHRSERAYVNYASTDRLSRYVIALWTARRKRPAYVYINSAFNVRFAIVPMILHRLRWWGDAQVVIAPRGEFDPGAVAIKAAKKKFFLRAARIACLYRRVWWHASTEVEAARIRTVIGRPVRLLVKENETGLPTQVDLSLREYSPHQPIRLVTAGRISPKKQIDTLIKAVSGLAVEVEVCGSADDQAYYQMCLELVRQNQAPVTFLGHLHRSEVLAAYRRADFAVFPTAGENFGHAIVEALSCGTPVLIQDVTPWTDRVKDGGGHIVESGEADVWRNAIALLAAESHESLQRRAAKAAKSYENWARNRDLRSFLDHLVTGGESLDVPIWRTV